MTAIGPQVRIRELRLAYGLTIPALVARISEHGVEVDANHISNIECGRKRASYQLMTAWSRALGVSPLDVHQPASTPADPSTLGMPDTPGVPAEGERAVAS